MKVLSLLLLAGAAAPVVWAGGRANTCALQKECFDVTMEIVDSGYCGAGGAARRLNDESVDNNASSRELSAGMASDCDWKVCMTWNFDKPGCIKDSDDTLTNICSRSPDFCASVAPKDYSAATLINKPGNGHTECVIVGSYEGATFLLRDQRCDGGWIDTYDVEGVAESFCGQASNLGFDTCTTKNGAEKECMWQFKTPACPEPTGTVSTPPSAAPTDSPTDEPTEGPSDSPSAVPTDGPTDDLSASPTRSPVDTTEAPTDWFDYWIRNAPPPDVSCECVDYFTVPADGYYKISNLQYTGGIEVQMRQRIYKNGAYYNEAAVVNLGSALFEVYPDGYYVDGAEVSLPTTVGGRSVTLSTYSDGREVAEIDLGPYALQFTQFNGGDNLHLRVTVV